MIITSHTVRWYNKPNNKFYWHPWQQIPPEKSFDGSRKGFKRYVRKVKRLNDKLEVRRDLANTNI